MRSALVVSSMFLLACGTPPPPGGTGGGGGTTAARCNSTNCAGCCDATDVCQLGQSSTACGTGGNACLACGTGLACSNGLCAASGTGGGTGGTGGGTGSGGGGGSTGPKRIFVTSTNYSGNLRAAGGGASGLAGGDALCNVAAQAAGIGGTWVAWLSTSTVRAADRITGTGPWLLMGTTTVVFNNKANLSTQPQVPIDRDENGTLNPSGAWTGTTNGGGGSGNDCSDWTAAFSSYSGTYGYSSQNLGKNGWTNDGTNSCSAMFGLICFEL